MDEDVFCERDDVKSRHKSNGLTVSFNKKKEDTTERTDPISDDDILNLIIDLETKTFDEIVA